MPAIDLLSTQLSVHNREQLTLECGWPQGDYIETIKSVARRILISAAGNSE